MGANLMNRRTTAQPGSKTLSLRCPACKTPQQVLNAPQCFNRNRVVVLSTEKPYPIFTSPVTQDPLLQIEAFEHAT